MWRRVVLHRQRVVSAPPPARWWTYWQPGGPGSGSPAPRLRSRDRGRGCGCVQELRDHRGKPLAAVGDGDVGGAREHRELAAGQAGDVAGDAAAEQPEYLYGVLGSHDVG